MNKSILIAAILVLAVGGDGIAMAQPPVLSPVVSLPGDGAVELAAETQEWPEIAAGGPGYLVVWQDMRPVLSGNTNTPDLPLTGNNWDIYGALLDASGNVIKSPIVVSQRGKNDTRPQVAWNGENWLVVWTSERPDWYFFEDVVGARVSPDGEVLDPEPIMIRPENNDPANDLAEKPSIGSDGTNWVIVWEAITWEGFSGDLNITGRRMAPDGTLLEEEKVLYQFEGIVFGPENPHIVWATDQYLLVWEDFGDLKAQRFDALFEPIDLEPIDVTTSGSDPEVATNGTDFLIVTNGYRAFRVTRDGVPLDGNGGISFDPGGSGWQPDGPKVDWDGSHYVITMGNTEHALSDSDVYVAKIDPAGNLAGPALLYSSPDSDWTPVVASSGQGESQIAWVEAYPEEIRALQLDAAGTPGPSVDVGVGLHRQSYLRTATNGDEHLAVYISEGGRATRLLAQRLNKTGGVIDREPVLLTTYGAGERVYPDVAFNGTLYLVTWSDSAGSVWGQRLDRDGVVLDPQPVELVNRDSAVDVGVGALADTFLVTYTHTFSGDQRYLKAARVTADLTVLDTPFTIGFDFAKEPRVAALGSRWLVVWEDQTNHDRSSSSTAGVFVNANGTSSGSFTIDQSGYGDDPDLAVLGDRALVVWYDNANFGDSHVEGRIVLEDGSFLGGEIFIADAPNDQFFTRAGVDGDQFIAAWVDFRGNQGIEQLRGDVWAARIGLDGTVLDPGGFQVTIGFLPEDLPDVAGADGRAILAFSQLDGVEEREVQRIAQRTLGVPMSLTVAGSCPGEVTLELAGAEPFGSVALVSAAAPGQTSLPGGPCAGITLDLDSPSLLGSAGADAEGRLMLTGEAAADLCGHFVQAVDAATCGTSSFVQLP